MEVMNWKKWEGKKAFIILNNNFEYNCLVNFVTDVGDGRIFFDVTDKFGEIKVFLASEIKFIEEKYEK